MKVSLNEDMIVSLNGETEIGPLPKNVGLERLRWDGSQLVDLANVSSIWVRYRNGAFTLHAIEVSKAQQVAMSWADRKRLYIYGGVIRVRTVEETAQIKEETLDRMAERQRLLLETISLINTLTYEQIDNHINTVFGALSNAQKTSLKKLYRVVLFLAKRATKEL